VPYPQNPEVRRLRARAGGLANAPERLAEYNETRGALRAISLAEDIAEANQYLNTNQRMQLVAQLMAPVQQPQQQSPQDAA
jgi:hypothetical protein